VTRVRGCHSGLGVWIDFVRDVAVRLGGRVVLTARSDWDINRHLRLSLLLAVAEPEEGSDKRDDGACSYLHIASATSLGSRRSTHGYTNNGTNF
jgi:hypothetical protein